MDAIQHLRVVYWTDPEQLHQKIIDQVTSDLRSDEDADRTPAQIWGNALKEDVSVMQILTPVRGQLHGTEHLNTEIQKFKSAYWLSRGAIDGVTMMDKVIQIQNKSGRKALKGYDFHARDKVTVDMFNGEIGCVVPTGNWKQFFSKSKWSEFRLRNFSVQFSGKEHISVNYEMNANSKVETNLELAYAVSVHKAQGSEFSRVYFVLPEGSPSTQMKELVYTALTRASTHCTVFVENGVHCLVNAMRPEQSSLTAINSSLFEFRPVNEAIANKRDWYEAGKIHEAITGDMVRSKSEVIIANMLQARDMKFWYEKPLIAPDGTMYLPDFTVQHQGEFYYWEHLGMLSLPAYAAHWEKKKAWYEENFPGKLRTTEEGSDLSKQAEETISGILGV